MGVHRMSQDLCSCIALPIGKVLVVMAPLSFGMRVLGVAAHLCVIDWALRPSRSLQWRATVSMVTIQAPLVCIERSIKRTVYPATFVSTLSGEDSQPRLALVRDNTHWSHQPSAQEHLI